MEAKSQAASEAQDERAWELADEELDRELTDRRACWGSISSRDPRQP